MLNVVNLNRLIAHLETIPDRSFGMLNYADERISVDGCGAPACIAGWALALRDGFYDPKEDTENFVSDDVADWLGLPDDDDLKWQLFGPDGYKEAPERFTRRRALRTLYHLHDTYLRTGEVVIDWGPEPLTLRLSRALRR